MDPLFADWRRAAGDQESTVGTRLATLRRLERVHGDLDDHWSKDGCQSLLAQLVYTAADERNDVPDPSGLNLVGNLPRKIANLKAHLTSYVRFKEQDANGELPEAGGEDSDESAAQQLTFGLEADLQHALRSNISQLADDLVLMDKGHERRVQSGFIDILAQDPDGTLVVIELKAVPASPATLAQVLSYMNDLQESERKPVRGIIVAPDFHPRLIAACRQVPKVQLVRYRFNFAFESEA